MKEPISFAMVVGVAALAGLAPREAAAQLSSFDDCPIVKLQEDESPEAIKAHMRAGIEASRKGDWQGAWVAFRGARCGEHTVSLAASLADVEMKLGRHRDAAEHWEYFLKNALEEMGEARRRAHEELAECRSHLGRARVIVNRDVPVQIVVDKKSLEFGVGDDIWLSPGEHEFAIGTDRVQSPPQRVRIVAGAIQTIPFEVPSTEPRPPAKAPVPASAPDAKRGDAPVAHDRQSSSSARTGVLITGAGLTAAGVGLGILFTLESNAAADKMESLTVQLDREGDPELVAKDSECTPPPGERPAICDELGPTQSDYTRSHNWAVGTFVGPGSSSCSPCRLGLIVIR